MYRIDFKDKNNEDLQLTTLSAGRRQRAKERLEIYSIPASNQEAIEHTGIYEPYERTMVFYVENDEQINTVNAWLHGYGKLRTFMNPGGYFKAHVISGLEYSDLARIRNKMTVTFKINPGFFFLDSGEIPISMTAPGTIVNPGTVESDPLIRIVGSGDITLTINGRIMTFTGIETFLDIDPEITPSVFKNNENVGEKMVGDLPFFDVGNNIITWTGSVTEINILGRWREL